MYCGTSGKAWLQLRANAKLVHVAVLCTSSLAVGQVASDPTLLQDNHDLIKLDLDHLLHPRNAISHCKAEFHSQTTLRELIWERCNPTHPTKEAETIYYSITSTCSIKAHKLKGAP